MSVSSPILNAELEAKHAMMASLLAGSPGEAVAERFEKSFGPPERFRTSVALLVTVEPSGASVLVWRLHLMPTSAEEMWGMGVLVDVMSW